MLQQTWRFGPLPSFLPSGQQEELKDDKGVENGDEKEKKASSSGRGKESDGDEKGGHGQNHPHAEKEEGEGPKSVGSTLILGQRQ